MIFERKTSFDRSWKALSSERKAKAKIALQKLILFFEGGPKPDGLGLKKLRKNYWEVRTDLRDRIVFSVSPAIVSFIILGNHDDIHRLLKRL